MLHLRGCLRLALKSLEERRANATRLTLRLHDRLHRDHAIEQRVAGLVDDAHRSLADRLHDLVATDALTRLFHNAHARGRFPTQPRIGTWAYLWLVAHQTPKKL